ncbi:MULTISPECIES: NADH-dependent [FeFe] hydrogenase, group A6 [unclassified Breznakia]|uniref:NADH-dependent [FeFe] hydrogenase, group A6 n=1 Tax=unclassified Breznakia TaxID=2623764 RepID=UPI002473D22D|nr:MULTISPECIES: NADH-dependent [FeFe] hydrogenase, group A6 [unclassified Breznakia]MDH6366246.1 NADP-reducing hydrogenase subunit HndD [Breznakia sp. PH1-1]MDH6403339.1 NADP-reducing hydrogenase subunit HndD [Breznakia sp. PF1-11]MDH6411048.1 NADP-reducing hydrogenase subunit HndD [Breznakia sp. PFB1-11]MDH6413412.1 NADP-reducing hydrogenase subunit HndD [Breznakia sp. PFB1-14]MDH6416177.1 NADP-reducing hydrogenase subunit HndD [Breznakia sp. PFB1-4]
MSDINLKVNGIDVTVPKGTTVMSAAKLAGVEIPSLCYLREVSAIASCRICVVEIKGRKGLTASCVLPAEEGMEVFTNTKTVRDARKGNLELLLSDHNKKCLSCVRSTNCELQELSREYGVEEDKYPNTGVRYEIDNSSEYVVRDNNKCILCRRCVSACVQMQAVNAIGAIDRGHNTHIGCAFERNLENSPCVGCGQCIVACPVGALSEKNHEKQVWDAISDPNKRVVMFTAPSVRAQIGEAFGMPIGTNAESQMIAASRRLGFDAVFNMDVTADLTIVEEANELVDRVSNGGVLPMFTSCCPGWVKFAEHNYPEMLPNLSTCKSPQQMFGALLKSYYCEQENIDPKDLFVVSVIPCTAKKFEAKRGEQHWQDDQDVDVALTTRELAHMIKEAAIQFEKLDGEDFDNPFECGSGAGTIFGASGGVMEAALRTAGRIIDPTFDKVEINEVRGTKGIKKATYKMGDLEVKVAVVSGLANARKLMKEIEEGKEEFHMIEVMACPGGCVNGGGQIIPRDKVRNNIDVRTERAKVLYKIDDSDKYRVSHETPTITRIYDEFLGKPGHGKAHELLHTTYVKREKL